MDKHTREEMLATVLAAVPVDWMPDAQRQRVAQFHFPDDFGALIEQVVAETFAPAVNRPIAIHSCAGETRVPVDDGWFYIYHHAKPPQSDAGAPLPSGAGIPVLRGRELEGELIDNALYLYNDSLASRDLFGVIRFADLLVNARRQLVMQRMPEMVEVFTADLAAECLYDDGLLDKVSVDQLSQAARNLEGLLLEVRSTEHELVRTGRTTELDLSANMTPFSTSLTCSTLLSMGRS